MWKYAFSTGNSSSICSALWDNYAYFPVTWWSAVTIQSHSNSKLSKHIKAQVRSSNIRRSPQFDPSGDLTSNVPALETADITQIALDSSKFLPSIFEETETFGPDVAAANAQRVNNAVSKKPLGTKFKELQDNYKSPKNCNFLCAPKVNLELWYDLPRSTKSKDLGLQEIQKHLVKSAQPMIQLLDTV